MVAETGGEFLGFEAAEGFLVGDGVVKELGEIVVGGAGQAGEAVAAGEVDDEDGAAGGGEEVVDGLEVAGTEGVFEIWPVGVIFAEEVADAAEELGEDTGGEDGVEGAGEVREVDGF